MAGVDGPGSGWLKAWVAYDGRRIVAYLLIDAENDIIGHPTPYGP